MDVIYEYTFFLSHSNFCHKLLFWTIIIKLKSLFKRPSDSNLKNTFALYSLFITEAYTCYNIERQTVFMGRITPIHSHC